MRSVSLRLRLIGLVAIGLAVSMVLGAAIAAVGASRSVQTEMQAALGVARRAVENAAAAGGAEPRGAVESVIAAFNDNRHVRLRLEVAGRAASAAPPVEEPPIGAVPAWFARWIDAH